MYFKRPSIFMALSLVLLTLIACSKTEENVPLTIPTAEIEVDNIVRPSSIVNQNIPFSVVTDAGEDVTDIATFYVNDEAIEGHSFSSDTIGEFQVYAVYIDAEGVQITTNTETFNVIIPKQKIIVEDYTGTWCGFCPRVTAAIHNLEEETTDIAVVAIHETGGAFQDPMHFSQVQILKDAFGVEGFPAARINRTIDWTMPHNAVDVTNIAGLDTDLAISINSELTGDELLVQVNVVYENGSEIGDKLVVYLLEDGIISEQINYYNEDPNSPYFGLGDTIDDFVHNDALRHSFTGVLGSPIPNTPVLTEYISSYNFNIPSDYVIENLEIVAMVVGSDNTGKNAQFAHIGEVKPYE